MAESAPLDKLDAEWIQLIEEAKTMGLSIEEIQQFIYHNSME